MYSLCKQKKLFWVIISKPVYARRLRSDVKCRGVKDDRIGVSYAQPTQFQVLFSQFFFLNIFNKNSNPQF